MIPEFLYHGTNENAVYKIRHDGITPRGGTRASTWGEVPSARDRVYLAQGYAPFFAASASKEGERHALVEVRTDRLDYDLLAADEDFVGQILAKEHGRMGVTSWEAFNNYVLESDMCEGLAEESLSLLGTCAYKGTIHWSAVARVSLYDIRDNMPMALTVLDPSISLLNWRFCSEKYRVLTKWLMGDDVTVHEWVDTTPGLRELFSDHHWAQVKKMLEARNVEIRTV